MGKQGDKRPSFILASNSPRRRQLLVEAGYRFEVASPPMPEPDVAGTGMLPAQQAEALAYFKARSVFEAAQPTVPVLGADTVVALGDDVFGTRHQVISGVALIGPSGCRLLASDITHVRMRPMKPAELDAYVDSGLWRGKSGSYGIQDSGDPFVECVEGSFTNVVGLPMELLDGLFAQLVLRHCL